MQGLLWLCGSKYFTTERVGEIHAERRKSGNKRRKLKEGFCILSDRPKGTCDGLVIEVEDCNDWGLLHFDSLTKQKSSTKS